jgi:hypothetical protein
MRQDAASQGHRQRVPGQLHQRQGARGYDVKYADCQLTVRF